MICTGKGTKIAFPTEAKANERGRQLKMKSYRCSKCGLWHLTRGKKKRRWWNKQKKLRNAIWNWSQETLNGKETSI